MGTLATVLAPALLLVCAAMPEPQDTPKVVFPRSRLKAVLSTEEGLERKMPLDNTGDVDAVLERVEIGDPRITLSLRDGPRDDPRPVPEDGRVDLPLAAGGQVRVILRFDGSKFEVGQYEIPLHAYVKGLAQPLDAVVDLEVVDPEEEDFDPEQRARVPDALVTEGPQPRLTVDRHVHDFGEVLSGEDIETEFHIKNEGEGPLVLQAIRKQCSCSVAKLILGGTPIPKEKFKEEKLGALGPGEEATLVVRVDTTGKMGTIDKTFWIYTNDKAQGHQTPLKVSAEVKGAFQANPPSLIFGDVRSRESPTIRVVLSSEALPEFGILGHSMKEPVLFDVETHPLERRRKGSFWEIVVKLREGAPFGDYKGLISFSIDNDRVKKHSLSYSVNVLGDIDFLADGKLGDFVDYNMVKPPVGVKHSFEIVNHNADVPYVPSEVVVEALNGVRNSALRATVVELEAGKHYRIDAELVEDPGGVLFQYFLRVKSAHAQLPERILRIKGIYRGAPGWIAEDATGGPGH